MSHEINTVASRNIEIGLTELKITIEGETDIPFWNHDLKIKATLALLESIGVLSLVMNNLPTGLAYAVWTGIGIGNVKPFCF